MPINRKSLMARHAVRLSGPDAQAPLSVGNGEFAFTADITGLQTFPEFHLTGIDQIGRHFRGTETPDGTWAVLAEGLLPML